MERKQLLDAVRTVFRDNRNRLHRGIFRKRGLQSSVIVIASGPVEDIELESALRKAIDMRRQYEMFRDNFERSRQGCDSFDEPRQVLASLDNAIYNVASKVAVWDKNRDSTRSLIAMSQCITAWKWLYELADYVEKQTAAA